MTRALLLTLALSLGCAAGRGPAGQVDLPGAPFGFAGESLAFANETAWDYAIDPVTREVSSRRATTPRAFTQRCSAMARAARQFHAAARFEPDAPPLDDRAYQRIVRAILDTSPRRPPAERIAVPGYRDLRALSAAREALFKSELAGPQLSYLQRGNWRMIFPFPAWHQRQTAERLLEQLAHGWPPIVHLLQFPALTINHHVLVFAADESPAEIRFHTYDPNDATRPLILTYDRAARTFSYSATAFFAGGPVKAYEVYAGWIY